LWYLQIENGIKISEKFLSSHFEIPPPVDVKKPFLNPSGRKKCDISKVL